MKQVDIAIVGAGPIGLAFARALAGSGLSMALIEQQTRAELAEPAFDGREIALTHASRHAMTALDWWSRLPAGEVSPLRRARVMNGHSSFALHFDAPGGAHNDLGWLIPNHQLRRAAWASVQEQPQLQVIDATRLSALNHHAHGTTLMLSSGETLTARLLVAADSRASVTRRLLGIGAQMCDVGKTMLVCRMQLERPHHHTAWEWFGHDRTIALLPLRDQLAGAVLTVPPHQADALMSMDNPAFNHAISESFEHRLGAMTQVGPRHAYPLICTYARRFVGARSALIGDAAVGMHPVTAHGFNFGLLSQRLLAEAVLHAHRTGKDIGEAPVLETYERAHRRATRPLYEATNALVSLYADERAPARVLRHVALRAAALVPPFRQLITRQLVQRADGDARPFSVG